MSQSDMISRQEKTKKAEKVERILLLFKSSKRGQKGRFFFFFWEKKSTSFLTSMWKLSSEDTLVLLPQVDKHE